MDPLDGLSEAIERSALISLHEHCPAKTREVLGLQLLEFGDALAAIAAHDPSILLNRTLGLGTLQTPEPRQVADVAAAYDEAGVGRYFFHVYEDEVPSGVVDAFRAAGLERVRGWMKFRRAGDAPVEDRPTDLEVRLVDDERGASDFGRIVAEAFGMTREAGPLLAGLGRDDRWYLFVSYDGDEAAGAGALMVDDGVGWLEWGATSPAFRRRGSQGAIMAARLRKAQELRCSHVFTETGEAKPGDPQHSYGNIEKAGFAESRLRQNFAPEPQ
ncbi:MAG: hypothetical protein ACQEXJ_05840 [Myxococcota bacterium]